MLRAMRPDRLLRGRRERAMTTPPRDDVRNPAHWLGFLISGMIAFSLDAAITKALVAAGTPVLVARLAGIAVSMVGGWLAHRRFTFALKSPPAMAEFAKYAGVSWTAAAVNYAVFAAILYIMPTLDPVAALFFSSLVAMAFAYLGMRFAAFRNRSRIG